jgi:adenine deaminase
VGLDSVKAAPVTADDFRVAGGPGESSVIGVVPGRIITEHLRLSLPSRGGVRYVDLDGDVVKVAVVARHGVNRNIGLGFVKGFGMRRGAIASSIGHDSHNICVVGADDADMAAAVNRLIEIQGGFAVVSDGEVRAELPLPIAGLMSDRSYEWVRDALHPLRAAARGLGVVLPEPFLQVAFLPLPVIPHLKITDLGLVDVDRFELVRE